MDNSMESSRYGVPETRRLIIQKAGQPATWIPEKTRNQVLPREYEVPGIIRKRLVIAD